MKRVVIFLLSAVVVACNGSLSDEQKRQMHENMEAHKIVRVTEVEIMEAAYAEGRRIAHVLDSLANDSTAMRAFLNKEKGRVRFLRPDASNARLLEKQLIDAYLADPSGSFEDNVQELRAPGGNYDSLLYTRPVTTKLPDGSDRLEGVWNIWLPKKELVMDISKRK